MNAAETNSIRLSLALAALCSACGATSVCPNSSYCPPGTVCQVSGQCGYLREDVEARFARATWLQASDWAFTRSDSPGTNFSSGDVAKVGGSANAQLYLAFGPLPLGVELLKATLVLSPHESWSGPETLAALIVQRTLPFQGARLTRSNRPAAQGSPAAFRLAAPGSPRAIRVDLTNAVRQDLRARGTMIHLAVSSLETQDTWRLASPECGEKSSRPRLELLIR